MQFAYLFLMLDNYSSLSACFTFCQKTITKISFLLNAEVLYIK